MSLINFNKETITNTVNELESGQGEQVQRGSELAAKIENFKKI